MALGGIGLSYDDFCRLSPEDFAFVFNSYRDRLEGMSRDGWERMRMCSVLLLQPHLRKGKHLKPVDLLRFPWETESKPVQEVVSQAEALRRFEERLRR